MEQFKISGGNQRLRTSTLIQDRPDREQEQGNLQGESGGSSSTISRLIAGCWRSKKWFLVHFRELYLPSSRWTPSQSVRAERRNTRNSTTVHWRDQSNKYDLGCDAWTPQRRLLEYRRRPRPIRRVDRFHTIHHIGRETSRWVHMVREAVDEETNDIQVWLLVARNMERHVSCSAAKRKTKMDYRRTEAWQMWKIARYLLHWTSGCGVQRNIFFSFLFFSFLFFSFLFFSFLFFSFLFFSFLFFSFLFFSFLFFSFLFFSFLFFSFLFFSFLFFSFLFFSLIYKKKTGRESWKFRCQQQCLARSGEERSRKLVAILILPRPSTHASLKPTNLRESAWKELCNTKIMKTLLQGNESIQWATTIMCTNLFLYPKQWK